MTTQTTQTTDEQTASRHTKPLRAFIAFALLGVAGVILLQILLDWLWVDTGASFVDRSAVLLSGGLIGLYTVGLPLLAVLLASHVSPMLTQTRAVAVVALIEYGVIALLTLVSLVTGVMALFDHLAARDILMFLLDRGVSLTLFGLAGFVTLKVLLSLSPKPAAAPAFGGYPPQQFSGQQYPQHQAYAQPAAATAATAQAAPGTAAAAQTAYGQQAAPQTYGAPQQAYGQQAGQQTGQHAQYGYGQQAAPQQASGPGGYPAGYGAQASAPTSAAPASGAPATSPSSGPPAGGYGYTAEQAQAQHQAQAQQQAQAQAQQQAQAQAQQHAQAQQQVQPGMGWPPPPSAAQWPPTPAAKAENGQSAGDEVQHTQVLRNEQYPGQTPG